MAKNFSVVLQGGLLDPEIPFALYVLDVTLNAVSSITTILGNTLIIVALRKIRARHVHMVFKAFLFNLALADLSVGLLVQLPYILAVLTAMSGYAEVYHRRSVPSCYMVLSSHFSRLPNSHSHRSLSCLIRRKLP